MSAPAQNVVVRMAELQVVKSTRERPVILKSTLGSCVGIILADRRNQVYGLAHAMLPEKVPGDQTPGKYADSAVPALLALMEQLAGAPPGKLEAFLVGGAAMFEASGLSDIGERNVRVARQAVGRLGIPVVFDDTGGSLGRTVLFDCQSATASVRTLKPLEPAGRPGGKAGPR
jgi:chemotaxis protein CheD